MTGLPSGTVTVLFTDIEGSAERRERDSQTLWLVAERHIVLLDEPIKAHGGVRFKTVGDGVQAAATLQGERLETTKEEEPFYLALVDSQDGNIDVGKDRTSYSTNCGQLN